MEAGWGGSLWRQGCALDGYRGELEIMPMGEETHRALPRAKLDWWAQLATGREQEAPGAWRSLAWMDQR